MDDNYMEVNLISKDDRVKFDAVARNQKEIAIDFFPPYGNSEGYTSLELLLSSFASCVGSTLLIFLRNQMHKTVDILKISAVGFVRDEHPKAIQRIELSLGISSSDVTSADVSKSLAILESTICPVWAMLKGNVVIDVDFHISNE